MESRSICRVCPDNAEMHGQHLTYPEHSFTYDCEYKLRVVLKNEFVVEECVATLQIYPEPEHIIAKVDIT